MQAFSSDIVNWLLLNTFHCSEEQVLRKILNYYSEGFCDTNLNNFEISEC